MSKNMVSFHLGPSLYSLDEATNDWFNVNIQIYTMGTTNFKTNLYTECHIPSCQKNPVCDNNIYTWEQKSSKARMITLQEVMVLGCKYNNIKHIN